MPNIEDLELALSQKIHSLQSVQTNAGCIELTLQMREELKISLQTIITAEITRQKDSLLCFIDQELFALEKSQY